ncbi:MAG: hypothetical protein MUC88_26390, partial [Planctomycetes bacterium]|nr:hypothetical protein [Planctomycetota bacterium]
GDHAVVLGWNHGAPSENAATGLPAYTITLPEVLPLGLLLDERMALSFSLADTGRRCPRTTGPDDGELTADTRRESRRGAGGPQSPRPPIDLTVELVAADGNVARLPLSHVTGLQPALRVTFTKWPFWERTRYKSPLEPVLQTYTIPFADFARAAPGFDPGLLRQIRFRFDRTPTAVILLDDVGLVSGRNE